MITLLLFLAVLSILVISHEYGHFITARKSGITVEEFGFGFPPRIVGVRRLTTATGSKKWQVVWGKNDSADQVDGAILPTLYSLNIIPLGGFVKIKGETATAAGAADPDSFTVKPAWRKMLVLTAGVLMNVLVALVLFTVGFIIGVPQNLEQQADVSAIPDHHVEVISILPGSPAAAAGLQPGDQIIGLDQTLVRPRLPELQAYMDAKRDAAVELTVERNNELLYPIVRPTVSAEVGRAVIGVSIAEVGTVRYPWHRAILEGAKLTGSTLGAIFAGFYDLIRDLITGKGAGSVVSGPVGVAVMTGEVARLGLSYLIQFVAILSLNLAVLNILPIPALDGGRLLFVVLATVFRRPVRARIEEIAHVVGFAALLLLVVVITIKDISGFSGQIVTWVKTIF